MIKIKKHEDKYIHIKKASLERIGYLSFGLLLLFLNLGIAYILFTQTTAIWFVNISVIQGMLWLGLLYFVSKEEKELKK